MKKEANYKFFKLEITKVAADNTITPPQLSDIELEYEQLYEPLEPYSDYVRMLDIDNAVHSVIYKENGTTFTRECFMSYPDNVMVMRLKADKGGCISRTFGITSPQPKKRIFASGNTLTMTGQPALHKENGLKFAQQVKVLNKGGYLEVIDNKKIRVKDADEVILLMSAATNYQQSMDEKFDYFSDEDPLTTVKRTLMAAESKTYEDLLSSHKKDYKALYDREFEFGKYNRNVDLRLPIYC